MRSTTDEMSQAGEPMPCEKCGEPVPSIAAVVAGVDVVMRDYRGHDCEAGGASWASEVLERAARVHVDHERRRVGTLPAGWLDQAVRYNARHWQLTTTPARIEWRCSSSGIVWTVDVAVRADSLIPGAARLSASVPADAPGTEALGSNLRAEVEAFAVGLASQIELRGDPRSAWQALTDEHAIATCVGAGKQWRSYVRRVMDSEVPAAPVARAGGPDYRRVAEVYLAALRHGRNPRQQLRNKLDCPSMATAGKWIQRAAEAGWLEPRSVPTRGPLSIRRAGPRLRAVQG